MSYKPIDSKRDQFRKYIESKGVVEILTKVFVQLLESPEKPEHPIEFICENLGSSIKQKVEMDLLKQEVITYRNQVEELKKQLEDVQQNQQIAITGKADIVAVVPAVAKVAEVTSADSVPEPAAKELTAAATVADVAQTTIESHSETVLDVDAQENQTKAPAETQIVATPATATKPAAVPEVVVAVAVPTKTDDVSDNKTTSQSPVDATSVTTDAAAETPKKATANKTGEEVAAAPPTEPKESLTN